MTDSTEKAKALLKRASIDRLTSLCKDTHAFAWVARADIRDAGFNLKSLAWAIGAAEALEEEGHGGEGIGEWCPATDPPYKLRDCPGCKAVAAWEKLWEAKP